MRSYLLCCALALLAGSAGAEPAREAQGTAHGDVRLEHGGKLDAATQSTDGMWRARQRVAVSNYNSRGMCLDLEGNGIPPLGWALRAIQAPGPTLVSATSAGYRVCLGSTGYFELELEHTFSFEPPAGWTASATPVAP